MNDETRPLRVEQRSGFLLDLIRDVRQGKLAPAAFQRPYVWSDVDVEAFWTSLLRKWPIGSIMIWTPGPGAKVWRDEPRLGPIETDTSAIEGVILDGQNRLATFAWSMRLPGQPIPFRETLSPIERETWGSGRMIALDAETRSAMFRDEDEVQRDPRLIPAGLPVDNVAFNRYLRSRVDLLDDDIEWFDHVGHIVREARISWTRMIDGTPEEALEAFLHICRAGVPMDEDDFRAAVGWQAVNPQIPQVR